MEHHSQSDKTSYGLESNRLCKCVKTLALAFAFTTPLAFSTTASAADASDKNPTPEEVRQLTNGVGIDRVIDRDNDSDPWKLLEEGFTIECSARFESGCQLFLQAD